MLYYILKNLRISRKSLARWWTLYLKISIRLVFIIFFFSTFLSFAIFIERTLVYSHLKPLRGYIIQIPENNS